MHVMYVFFKVSIHIQQTTQLKHNAACLQHRGGDDRQHTDDKRQRDARINGRRMRKWIGTAGSPGTGSRKIFQTSGNKYLFKYINIYNIVYQRYTGPEKERRQRETGIKHGCGEFKKEECRHRGLLKQKRITEAECKGKEQKRKCKKWEMQK